MTSIRQRAIDAINRIAGVRESLAAAIRWRVLAYSGRTGHTGRMAIYRFASPFLSRSFTSPRMYLRPGLDLEGFFSNLNAMQVRCVVLRWFDDLPEVGAGEDIDLLVADQDLARVRPLLTPIRLGTPFDIYSVTGVKGTAYGGLPYYPPNLANELLDHRVLHKGIYPVPNPWFHFVSLAYHAVYHKGVNSGLSRAGAAPRTTADHDYEGTLRQLAAEIGLSLPAFSFDALHEFLAGQGWTPRLDTLRKMSIGDPWIADLLPRESAQSPIADGEFAVFVAREWAVRHDKLGFIADQLSKSGFRVIMTQVLSEEQKRIAATLLRGQKWDRGPFPVDGGLPACFIACFDPNPAPLTDTERRSQPFVQNRHLFAKIDIRDTINRQMFRWQWVNCLHAADDENEAWDYVESVTPESLAFLRGEVARLRLHAGDAGSSACVRPQEMTES